MIYTITEEQRQQLLTELDSSLPFPVRNGQIDCVKLHDACIKMLKSLTPVSDEPVAWRWDVVPGSDVDKRKGSKSGVYFEDPSLLGIPMDHSSYVWTTLYTHPQRELSDEEIDALALDETGLPNSHLELARAALKAARSEK